MCITRHAKIAPNKLFASLWNMSRKSWWMKLVFCLQINTKVFYTIKVPLWVCVGRHSQSTQNNKFAGSLQYLWSLFFVCRWMSKVSSNWYYHFKFVWPGMPKDPKWQVCYFFCYILRKNCLIKYIFCMQISMKGCYKLILWFWWGWSSIPKVPNTSTFQHFGYHSFLQGDTIITDGHDQAFSKYSKKDICNIFTISQKRS